MSFELKSLVEELALTGRKVFISSIIFLIYFIVIIVPRERYQCLMQVTCDSKTHHSVPNSYIGSTCGQVCATFPELIVGYILSIAIHIILPLIVIYAIVSSTPLVVRKVRKKRL